MAHRSGHASDLAVLALDQFEREPGIGDIFAETNGRVARRDVRRRVEQPGAAGESAIIAEIDPAAGELLQGPGGRDAFHLRPVFAAVGALRIEQPGVQAGLVAEQEQAFRIGIEPAERIDRARQSEVRERAPTGAGLGGELREDAVWLVKSDEHVRVCEETPKTFRLQPKAPFPMRAVQLPAVNQLHVIDVPDPKPAPGEVVVALRSAALNHRDVWIKSGAYAGLKWPSVPGSDGAGEVIDIGPGVDAAWRGREVIINASFDWGADERVQGPKFSILGLPRDGTLAERIAVPAVQLAPKPAHMNWAEAAALPLAGLTAYRALFSRANLQRGERVLVSGIGGGVALFALQFALAAGADVWVTSSSADKIARAVKLGASGGFDYRDPNWATEAAKAPGQFDVVIDSAGGEGFGRLIDATASGGRLVFYGATRGDAPLPVRKVFWRQISLLGSTMGSPADWAAMTAFVAQHKIKPVVSDIFPMGRAAEAFALMERGEQFGKIVVTVSA